MDRDTGKVNWVRGPRGSHSNSMGVERNQDTGSRKNWKEVEWRCGRGRGGVGTVPESLGHPVELGSGVYFDSMWPLRCEKGNGM